MFKATSGYFVIKLDKKIRRWLYWSGIVLLIFTLVQTVLGTQVREAVDVIKNSVNPPPREVWLNRVGTIDEIHRSFSWTIFLSGLTVFYLSFYKAKAPIIAKISTGIFSLILVQIGLGIGLYYFGMQPVFQILHLTIMAALFCLEFLFLLVVRLAGKVQTEEYVGLEVD